MIKDYILDAAIAGVFLMARTRFHVTSKNMALAWWLKKRGNVYSVLAIQTSREQVRACS